MNKASKIVMLGMAGLMAATSLSVTAHAAATAKDKMAKEMVVADEIKISGHAKAVLADVRGARFALFDGQTDAAMDLVKKARGIFNEKLAKFAIKFGENKGFGAPIDRSILFAEGFKPTPAHAAVIGKAGVLAQHGKTSDAVKMMKAADIELDVKYALLPISKSVASLDKAIIDINAGNFYEANMVLKSIETSVVVEEFEETAVPKQGYELKEIL